MIIVYVLLFLLVMAIIFSILDNNPPMVPVYVTEEPTVVSPTFPEPQPILKKLSKEKVYKYTIRIFLNTTEVIEHVLHDVVKTRSIRLDTGAGIMRIFPDYHLADNAKRKEWYHQYQKYFVDKTVTSVETPNLEMFYTLQNETMLIQRNNTHDIIIATKDITQIDIKKEVVEEVDCSYYYVD